MGSQRLQRTPDVVLRTIADETFLLPVRGDLAKTVEMFVLSEVGRFIWNRTDGQRGLQELVAEVMAVFDVNEAQARTDVAEFLDQLQAYGLLTASSE
jgi:hypothetical protein